MALCSYDGSLLLRWLFEATIAANTTLQQRIPLCNCEYHFATANTTFNGSLQLRWLFAATIAANTTLHLRIPLCNCEYHFQWLFAITMALCNYDGSLQM